MRLLSEFLGGWESFSEWEIKGLLRAYGGEIIERKKNYLMFDSEDYESIGTRVTFSKRIGRVLNYDELNSKKFEGKSFALREKKAKGKESQIDVIAKVIRGKVDLTNPDTTFYIYNQEETVITEILYERDMNLLLDDRYQNRPFNHPSSISPLLARGMLNISGIKEKDTFLDPFAGTGTFLIEGFRMKINGLGIDKNPRMVEGGNLNLQYFDFPTSIIRDDFSRMREYKDIRAIVTDPPYGRGSKVFSDSKKTLYSDFFAIVSEMKSKHVVFCLPNEELIELARNYLDFEIAQKIRVHSSLTRSIIVKKGVA